MNNWKLFYMQRNRITLDPPFHTSFHAFIFVTAYLQKSVQLYRWSPLELSKLFGRGHKLVSKSDRVEEHNTETILFRTNRSHFCLEQLGFCKSDRKWKKKSLPTRAGVFLLLMTCEQLLSENMGVQLISWSLHFCPSCWIALCVKMESGRTGRAEENSNVM